MAAKMIKALYQGKDWKEGNKKVAAHRHHTNSPNRRRRNKMGKLKPRGSKAGRSWEKGAAIAARNARFFKQRDYDKKHMTAEAYRDKYPRLPFNTNIMLTAMLDAGIQIPHGKEQRQEGQTA